MTVTDTFNVQALQEAIGMDPDLLRRQMFATFGLATDPILIDRQPPEMTEEDAPVVHLRSQLAHERFVGGSEERVSPIFGDAEPLRDVRFTPAASHSIVAQPPADLCPETFLTDAWLDEFEAYLRTVRQFCDAHGIKARSKR